VKELASLGIIVVTHPAFVYYSGDRYLRTVSSVQQRSLYPIGSLLSAGIRVAAASDAPIVDTNPLAGVFGAVTRSTADGDVVLAQEGITVQEALRIYTQFSAAASFSDATTGTISAGKWADLAVLSDDPFGVSEEAIQDIEVDMTLIGGEVVWSR
jgi:predicted amidohydrolase YtcJ